MRSVARAICALCLALSPLPAAAQERDAYVAPPGVARFRAAAEFARFDARFAPRGGTEPLTADFLAPLTSESFAPLRPLETELNRFFAAQGAGAVGANPQSLRLGVPDLEAAANVRVVPLSVAFGVLPRVEVGVSVPVVREEVLFTRAGLSGGTVGLNPARGANAELLARLGEEWRALGDSPLLPTDSSALGRELQRLVAERVPGGVLQLPDSAARFPDLDPLVADAFGTRPLASRLTPWRLGDAEVSARFQLLNTLGASPLPADSAGFRYRAALSVSARLPTGAEPDTLALLSFHPEVGQSGAGVGVDGDLFWGTRLWTTVSLHYGVRGEVEVVRRVVDPRAPLASIAAARTVRLRPGARFEASVAPRFRLTDAIALGAEYALAHRGDATHSGEGGDVGVLDAAGGLAQSAGLGIRYSTLPAYAAGARLLPLEVALTYRRTLDAPALHPRASAMLLQATVYHRVLGSRE